MAEGYINVKGPLYVGRKSVTIPANQGWLDITADNVTGYNFRAWLGMSSVGWVGLVYPENYSTKSTRIFTPDNSTATRDVWCFALYESLG